MAELPPELADPLEVSEALQDWLEAHYPHTRRADYRDRPVP